MQVKQRRPGIQVLLHKVVGRSSVNGQSGNSAPVAGRYALPTNNGTVANIIDITPWLGEGSVVRTQRSVREGTGGFSITMLDRYDAAVQDTLYTMIEPLDIVEIRFAGDAYKYAGSQLGKHQGVAQTNAQLPIQMWGWITDVERIESVGGGDGKPHCGLEISGHDYSKILQLMQLSNLPGTPTQGNLIQTYPMFANFGTLQNMQDAATFLTQFIGAFSAANPDGSAPTQPNNSVNGYIQKMIQAATSAEQTSPPTPSLQSQLTTAQQTVNDLQAQYQQLTAPSLTSVISAVAGAVGVTTSQASQAQALAAQIAQAQQQVSQLQATIAVNSRPQTAMILPITLDIQVPDCSVTINIGQVAGSSAFSILRDYFDTKNGWNEMFIEDRDAGPWGPAGPYLVYRPAPLLDIASRLPIQPILTDANGNPVSTSSVAQQNNPTYPVANTLTIDRGDITSISSKRDDRNIGNYFWVECAAFDIYMDQMNRVYALAPATPGNEMYQAGYPNCNPAVYGLRQMTSSTSMGGPGQKSNGNGMKDGPEREGVKQSLMGWINSRRGQLIQMNKDNVVFESGTLRMKGNENLRPGMYVAVFNGASVSGSANSGAPASFGAQPSQNQSLYYAHNVTHTFEVYGNYFCDAEYDRGTGFSDRLTSQVPQFFTERAQPTDPSTLGASKPSLLSTISNAISSL